MVKKVDKNIPQLNKTVEIQGKTYNIQFPLSDFYFSALIKFIETGYLTGGKDSYNTACDALLKFVPALEDDGLILRDGDNYTLILDSRGVGKILAKLQDLYFPPEESEEPLEELKAQLSEE